MSVRPSAESREPAGVREPPPEGDPFRRRSEKGGGSRGVPALHTSTRRNQSPAVSPPPPVAAEQAALDDESLHSAESTEREDEGTLGAVPEYPVHALPRTAQELVRHGERTGLPPALVAGAALAAMAAAIGGRAELEITHSWHERAILWIPLLAPRGAGKSPAQDLAFGPLRDHDAQLADEADGEESLLGDTTLEALARDLHGSGGSAAIDLDELASLLRGMGEYKRGGGGDRGRLLALWSGAPWPFRRVGSSGAATNAVKLRISRPTLVICGGLQPALHELLGGEEDGLRPRWLPHLTGTPDGGVGLDAGRVPVDWQVLLLSRLLSRRDVKRTWNLSDAARTAFGAYRAEWKQQARTGEAASVSAALVKADVHCARIVLVLAEAERSCVREIDAGLVHRAAEIVRFTLDCWRALPEQGALVLSRRDGQLDRAIFRLIAWLDDHGGEATRRELQRACVAGVRTAADLDALLRRYESAYPGTVVRVRQEHGKGLPSVVVKAPRRRSLTLVSASADTRVSGGQTPDKQRGSAGVRTADTSRADTSPADTLPEGGADAAQVQSPTDPGALLDEYPEAHGGDPDVRLDSGSGHGAFDLPDPADYAQTDGGYAEWDAEVERRRGERAP